MVKLPNCLNQRIATVRGSDLPNYNMLSAVFFLQNFRNLVLETKLTQSLGKYLPLFPAEPEKIKETGLASPVRTG